MTIIIGFTYVYLQSRNLLNNKHIYISLILQFLNATAVFIKSDTHLNDKLKESNKEIVNMKKDRSASILQVRSDDSLSSVANINRLHIEPIIVHSPISV
jgi:hypothetical protein